MYEDAIKTSGNDDVITLREITELVAEALAPEQPILTRLRGGLVRDYSMMPSRRPLATAASWELQRSPTRIARMWLRTVASVTPSRLEIDLRGAPAPIRSNTSSWRRSRQRFGAAAVSGGARRSRPQPRRKQVDQERLAGSRTTMVESVIRRAVAAGVDVSVEATYRPAAAGQPRVRAAGMARDRSVGLDAAQELPARAADRVRLGHAGEPFDRGVPGSHAKIVVHGEHRIAAAVHRPLIGDGHGFRSIWVRAAGASVNPPKNSEACTGAV